MLLSGGGPNLPRIPLLLGSIEDLLFVVASRLQRHQDQGTASSPPRRDPRGAPGRPQQWRAPLPWGRGGTGPWAGRGEGLGGMRAPPGLVRRPPCRGGCRASSHGDGKHDNFGNGTATPTNKALALGSAGSQQSTRRECGQRVREPQGPSSKARTQRPTEARRGGGAVVK